MNDEKFLKEAIKEAKKAAKNNEIPVGVVIVDNKTSEIVVKARNEKEKKQIATKHAEIVAIEKLSKKKKNWRLKEYTLYTTMEPCKMCKEVIKNAKISKVIYGTKNNSNVNNKLTKKIISNKKIREECANLIKNEFKKYREIK